MRLFAARVSPIATEVVRTLTKSGDIETEKPREVELDVESVLKSFLIAEKEVNDKTRDLLERTGRGASEFNRVRNQLAETSGIRLGDEALDYLLDQVVEMFEHSANVEEIFAENVELRRKMAPIFKRHMGEDDKLDGEVRAQLKHMREGTREWDVEYARMLEIVKRKKNLT
ncbi:hypothetical protein BH09MYX1_BH09MYX1_56450 [soil metagenome]